MRSLVLGVAVVGCALVAGCGGDDSTETASTSSSTTTTTTTEANLSPEEAITQTGDEWAPLFGAGSDKACDLMTSSANQACDLIYTDGKPSSFQASFANATVQEVSPTQKTPNGTEAAARFSNGEFVEFREVGDWLVSNLGGNAGRKFFK